MGKEPERLRVPATQGQRHGAKGPSKEQAQPGRKAVAEMTGQAYEIR